MRVCRACQRINGDTDDRCSVCGTDISGQFRLPPAAPLQHAPPSGTGVRNRRYLLLLLLPLVIAGNLFCWLDLVPSMLHDADAQRTQQLARNQQAIEQALAACYHDTGGSPMRLEVLQQFVVQPTDLTPGAAPQHWHGPYLPAGQPFPANPYRPRAGARGWRCTIRGSRATVEPAHTVP